MHKNICHLPIYDEQKCIFFGLGRNAMYATCQLLNIQRGDEIITPAFDCYETLEPFKALGCTLQFVKSDPYTFAINIEDIKRHITSRTKLLHVINHFGFAQDWDALLRLRQEIGIPIMEDNAYSLFSQRNGKWLGTFGDFSIFSLRKDLPLVDGGMLRINNPKYQVNALAQREGKWCYSHDYKRWIVLAGKQLGVWDYVRPVIKNIDLLRKRIVLRRLRNKTKPATVSFGDPIGTEFAFDCLRPMSKWAHRQLRKISFDSYCEIIKKKREHYQWLSERLQNIKGIKVLSPRLEQGIAPFCVSILVESRKAELLNKLSRIYEVTVWPTVSHSVLEQSSNFPEIEIAMKRLIHIVLYSEKVVRRDFLHYRETLVYDIKNFHRRE